jgi:DNA-binding transcriptional LysR family regulator
MSILSREADYFLAICETSNLARAAELLDLSPPALSRSLQRLEAHFGTRLFVRAPRGVELTPMGQALRTRLDQAKLVIDDAEREVAQLAFGKAGHVRMGAGHIVARRTARRVLPRLARDRPAARILLHVDFNAQLFGLVEQGALDFALCGLQGLDEHKLDVRPLTSTALVVVVRKGHRLTDLAKPRIEDLKPYRSVAPGPAVTGRRLAEERLAQHGIAAPSHVIESNDLGGILEIVAATDFYSLAPLDWLAEPEWVRRVVGLPIKELSFAPPTGLVTRRGGFISPLAQRAMELVEQEFGG